MDKTTLGNNTPPKYLFVLDGINGRLELKTAPLEWNSSSISLKRDFESAGIAVQFVTDTLTFVKEGERYLKTLFEQKGFFSECNLEVYYFDYVTRTYIQFPNSFRLDFQFYENVKVGRSRNAVKIKAVEVSLLAKFNTRKKIKVDVSKTTSIGGYEIPIQDHWTSVKDRLSFEAINSYRTASYESTSSTGTFTMSDTDNFLLPLLKAESDFTESQTILFTKNAVLDNTNAFFKDATEARTVDVDLDFTAVVSVAAIGVLTTDVYIRVLDTDGTSTVSTAFIGAIPNVVGTYPISYSNSFSLLTGQSLIIYGISSGAGTATIEITETEMTNSEAVTTSEATTIDALPIYEITERAAQLILDTQYPIYSTKFGRVDVVYNSDGDMYPTESQFSFANVPNGLSIRGLAFARRDNSVAVNMDDLLKSINAIYNIGWGFDKVGGEDRIVIEDRDDFYIDTDGLDLSDRLDELDVELKAYPDATFAQIKSGYKSFDYEEINGRGEYNTTNERTSKIPNDNTYNIVSPYRGDTKEIADLLSSPIGTNDEKGDNDIFIIKSQRNSGQWKAETDENIQILGNTSLFQDGSLNLYYTPTRNLLRHGYVVRAGLEIEPNSYLRHQISDKAKGAILRTTNGVDDITENQDILIDDLDQSIYDAVTIDFECTFYEEDFVDLVANKYKLIVVSDNLSGWLLDFKWKLNEDKAEFKLLKKYVASS